MRNRVTAQRCAQGVLTSFVADNYGVDVLLHAPRWYRSIDISVLKNQLLNGDNNRKHQNECQSSIAPNAFLFKNWSHIPGRTYLTNSLVSVFLLFPAGPNTSYCSLSLSLSLSLWLCVSVCLCMCLSVCLSLSLSVYVCLSLFVLSLIHIWRCRRRR